MSTFTVGQRVRALTHLINPANDHSPQSCYASKGDLLIVRRVRPAGEIFYNISVSHEDITDRTFGVTEAEIELIDEVAA